MIISSWNAKTTISAILLQLSLTLSPLPADSQTNLAFEFDPNPIVKVGTQPLSNPWAGGINFGQFSALDYDFDGDDDLIVFDRSGDEWVLFENTNSNYTYVYNSAPFFPQDARYRSAFADYDGDGKNDLFTYGIGGIKVYKNTGSMVTGLSWTLVSNLLMTDYLGSMTNLYVSSSDIPAYVDVEGDGDLDVLTFHLGGERIEYHQNQSMELYGHADSLIFVLKNECWGRFREDPNNNNVFLNDQSSPCFNGNIPNPQIGTVPDKPTIFTEEIKHSGSTLLAIDMNSNGVLDLILGDVAFPNLTLLMNGGTTPNSNSAMISQDHTFPSNSTQASIQLFPASYYLDVDFDGVKDLIVAPNARTVSENQRSVLWYKNHGTNTTPNFVFQQDNFLQDGMIDNGLGSIPTIVDQNGDGKLDLVIGSFFKYKPVLNKESVLLAYRNTGTASTPEYSYLDDDYLNFSALNFGLRSVPTFGDIDGDGDSDMLVGKEDGTVVKFTNNAGASNPLTYGAPASLLDNNGTAITVQSYAFPQLFDLDKDGLLDLIIGKKTGELIYYQNTGTSNSPEFTLINSNLGAVDISASPDGYAAPHFFRVNDTTHLFVGAYDGQLHYYRNIDGHLSDTFELVNPNYLGIDVGLYSSFWVHDHDNDGILNLFAGQDLGGLWHFEVNPNSSAAIDDLKQPQFILYPNPAFDQIHITGDEAIKHIDLYDMNGKFLQSSSEPMLNTANLVPGMYLLQITSNSGVYTKRFFKQ